MTPTAPLHSVYDMKIPDRLRKIGEPKHAVLAGFIHGCSPDPAVRTMAATALVFSLWQLAGRRMSPRPPSMILLNAGEAAPDPIDTLVGSLVDDAERNDPRMHLEAEFMGGSVELASRAMANALKKRQSLPSNPTPGNLLQIEVLEERYRTAQRAGFGYGHSRPYCKAGHESFGLLTGRDDAIILRLVDGADRSRFCEHVLHDPLKLLYPEGIGGGLAMVRKTIAVSGSLTPELWDEELAAGIVELGLPFFVLPHPAQEPLNVPNFPALDAFATVLPGALNGPVEVSPQLPPIDWFEHYETRLRKRLRELPGAYEFSVLEIVHQLGAVCDRISWFAGWQSDPSADEIAALFWDLQAQALRGIVLSVAALAWHGLGFDPGCSREVALKVLGLLREKGPMTLRELQRNARLKSVEARDALLERLAGEDLVRVEAKTVTAASCEEFVQALHDRPEFPQPANCWAAAAGGDEDKAGD